MVQEVLEVVVLASWEEVAYPSEDRPSLEEGAPVGVPSLEVVVQGVDPFLGEVDLQTKIK